MKNIVLLAITLVLFACSPAVKSSTVQLNSMFPQVKGNSLAQEPVTIPDNYLGKATLILVGYQQKAQFDIDRWMLGILQADVPVQMVEVPTIAGMMPQMVQSFIDNGMRSGIPKENWASVVTVFEDASKIIEVLGNERPQSAHVVLLNKQGQIVWTWNQGYAPQQVLELKKLVAGLD